MDEFLNSDSKGKRLALIFLTIPEKQKFRLKALLTTEEYDQIKALSESIPRSVAKRIRKVGRGAVDLLLQGDCVSTTLPVLSDLLSRNMNVTDHRPTKLISAIESLLKENA